MVTSQGGSISSPGVVTSDPDASVIIVTSPGGGGGGENLSGVTYRHHDEESRLAQGGKVAVVHLKRQ